MARFKDEVRITPDALRMFAESLRRLADIQERQAKAMQDAKVQDVSAKNLKTALASLANLGKFIGAATTAFCDQVSEEGVTELEGAVLQFRRYLKRGTKKIQEVDAEDEQSEGDAAGAEAFAEAKNPKKKKPKPRRDKNRDS